MEPSEERHAPSIFPVLATLALSMLMPSLDTSIANSGLPVLAQAFAASFDRVQWIVIAYLLAITTLIVGVGRLGDVVGRERLLIFGVALFTFASLVCGSAPTLWALIVARGVQGAGAAIMMALAVALVSDVVPQAKIGRAMGLLGTMSAIGTTLGPSLGGALIASLGWRAMFWINVPLGACNAFVAWRYLRSEERLGVVRSHFDLIGSIVLALTLGAYALAATASRGTFGWSNALWVLVACCGIVLFVYVEHRSASPLLRLAMFRDPMLGAGLGASALVATVLMATLVIGPFYLYGQMHLRAAAVGIVMSIGPLVAAIVGVPAGRLVDERGARRVTIVGLIGIAVGLALMASLPPAVGVWGWIAPIVVVTTSYALFQAANTTRLVSTAGADRRGVVSAMLNLSRNLGLITGASLMGTMFAAFGMRVTFGVAATLMLVAIVAVEIRSS